MASTIDNEPLLPDSSDAILLQPINNRNDDLDYYPSISTSRRPRFLQRIKQRLTKQNILHFLFYRRWIILSFGTFFVIGLMMFIFRKQFLQALEALSHKLQDMGIGGYLLMSSLIFMSAFPPIFGYSTYQTLSGYTYGFQIGFPISYLSGLLGAIVCFSLCRFFIKARVSRLLSNYSNLEAVVKAVEKKGFKLFLLIRISPYPFNLLNFFFASTSIPFSHFAVGTAISLLKIAVHVYIGANLTSFVEHLLGDDSNLTEEQLRAIKVKYVAFVVFSMIAMVVMAYLYRIAKAATAEANSSSPDDIVDEEQMSFLNHEEDEINASTITILSSETTTASPVFATHDEPAISISSISSWDAWDNDSSKDE